MSGRVVLVAGAGGGIGAATVRKFAASGWQVIATDADEGRLAALEPELVTAAIIGDVDTPMLRFQAAHYGGGDPDAYRRALLAKYPQGERARFIRPEEVAELVYFLCLPATAAVTGADFAIDQGYSAGK